jgi:hypothetical protein
MHLLRRFICFFFGHRATLRQRDTTLASLCARCGKEAYEVPNFFKYTMRANVTRGDIERRMAENPPKGYSFVDCNWKKRKAKFVSPNGVAKHVGI